MTQNLTSQSQIVEALRNRMRVGEGLTVPYARKWATGGCEASESLWNYPHDAIADFADELVESKLFPIANDDAIAIDTGQATLWVAVNGKTRSADRASEFLVGRNGEKTIAFVVNSPEVVIELIRAYGAPTKPIAQVEMVQVGFPGIRDDSPTYVGSWQWNVHGEAREENFVSRAANATLSAIRAKEAKRVN